MVGRHFTVSGSVKMQLIEFEWARCLDGYTIVPHRKRREPPAWTKGPHVITIPQWTVEGAPDAGLVAASDNFQFYRPIKIPALFQRFADKAPTADGMKEFADRFGLLGGLVDSYGPDRERERATAHDLGEMLAHHHALRAAASDQAALVRAYNVGWGRLRTRLVRQEDGKLAVVLVPPTLIQYLWVELAFHSSSGAKLLRCEHCGEPFRTGTGTGRRDTAKYCSPRCKT